MKLKSFNFLIGLLILILFSNPLKTEEKIDIWKNKEKKQTTSQEDSVSKKKDEQLNLNSIKTIDKNQGNKKFEEKLKKYRK